MNERHAPSQPLPLTQELMVWQRRLIDAQTQWDVGAVIVAMAGAWPGCERACLLWNDGRTRPCSAPVTLAEADWARAVLDSDGYALSADRRRVAWRVLADQPIVLLLHFAVEQHEQELRAWLELHFALARHHLRLALELAGLHESHRQLERSERLQHALFSMADLAGSDLPMAEMLRRLHDIVGTLMYGENFFIVRYEPSRETMRFIYYVDVEDSQIPDTTVDEPLAAQPYSLTWHLLTGGRSMLGNMEQLREQVDGPLNIVGPDATDWLGVPMRRDGRVCGGLVVQSYQPHIGYSEQDRAVLEFVASHVLTALERRQGKDELEHRVQLRTRELVEANQALQREVRERQRAEQLQAALFQLAQLATADIDESEFYERVHAVVGGLLHAENFFIALISDDRQRLDFPYYVDTSIRSMPSRPIGGGLSEYVLRKASPVLLRQRAEIDALSQQGEVVLQHVGEPAMSWLGVPLLVGDEVIGLVTVQSLDQAVVYAMADQELLAFAASQIANSIHRRRSAASLQQAKEQLEQRVEERTQELRRQIVERERVQEQLRHQVMHDPLTGLPNRGFLCDRVDRLLGTMQRRPERRCALLYLDLDHFKAINDSLGHLAGDEFLKMVARRLQLCVRDPEVVARLSGDEFCIVLEDLETPVAAINVAKRVLQVLSEPIQVAGTVLVPSISIGIAIGDHCYGGSDELLRDADTALYRAKQQGRHRFEVFEPGPLVDGAGATGQPPTGHPA